jgi:hypothetical protein
MKNMFGSYNSEASACCSSSLNDKSNTRNEEKNFIDALENCGSARTVIIIIKLVSFVKNIRYIDFKQITNQQQYNPYCNLSNGKEDFNSILQKRKIEESKNAKCKVFIRVKK